MLEVILQGIVLGMGVSVPFGPVNILILNTALSSFKNAFCVGLGALSADILFLILINLELLSFANNEFFYKILAVFGFFFLSFMVFLMLRKTRKVDLNKVNKTHPLKGFSKGFFLNVTNPYVIGFWVSVAGLLACRVKTLLPCFLVWLVLLCFGFLLYRFLCLNSKHL
ncbi:LysE family transporter [Campylobacter sp. CNRCH_2007_0968H]|uniref:LysE family transporter n=1 Tax=Campylobacter sp. CNRCH_2007_0968H TaxID=2911598 RepID=UPI003995D941